MRSGAPMTSTLLLAAISLTLSACAGKGVPLSPTLELTASDRIRTPNPPPPALTVLKPTTSPEAKAERDYLSKVLIKPLMDFSLAQEAAKQAEGQRADGVVAKVDAHNAVVAPKRGWWPGGRDRP